MTAIVVCCASSCGRSTPADPRTEISWLFSSGPDRALIESQVIAFEKLNPDIHIRMMWTPGGPQYQAKLKTLIAAGHAPDLFWCGDVWIPGLRPFLFDISGFVARDREELAIDDFYPKLLEAGRWNGRQYLLPRFFNVSLLYFNRTMFINGGVPEPTADWTWDDYTHAGQALTKRDAAGHITQWGSTIITGWWGEWHILLRQAGGRLFDDQFEHCLLGSPEARRGMNYYADKAGTLAFAPRPGRGPANGFASEKYAMHYGGHTGDWPLYKAVPTLDWDIQLLPKGPNGSRGGEVAIDAIGISKSTQHAEAAWKLVKFLHTQENIRVVTKLGNLPVRKSVAAEMLRDREPDAKPKHLALAFEAIDESAPPPQSADFIEVALEVIQPEIDLAIGEGRPMDECIDRAVVAADAFLKTLGKEKVDR